MKGKHWLRALLEHLALAVTLGEGARTRMFWLGTARDGTLELATADMPSLAQEAAAAWLADLAALWQEGQSLPLAFAPDAAFAWLEKLHKADDDTAAWTPTRAGFDDPTRFGDGQLVRAQWWTSQLRSV